MSTKFVFITGGVISSLGKGLATASLGFLLQSRGFKIKIRKLDPYLNVDPGTMNPQQHGEVFVTDDGAETDLDLGYYERFTGISCVKDDNVTAGKVYSDLLANERRGGYLGHTVQVIPHVTDLIKSFIFHDKSKYDFILCEIGGTVGDIEGQPFLEAIRQVGYEIGFDSVAYVHLTLVPYIASAKESKTKPTQHSVRQLNSMGIQPNLILCRSEKSLSPYHCHKIALFCNVKEDCVIPICDVESIYQIPIMFHNMEVDCRLLKHFHITDYKLADVSCWHNIIASINETNDVVTIGVVGKYSSSSDSYCSLIEALEHGGIANRIKIKIKMIDSVILNEKNIGLALRDCDGVIVPGGFGDRGIEGKICAIKYVREKKIPFFGICLGMQLVVVELMRNVVGDKQASSTEFSSHGNHVVGLLTEWDKDGEGYGGKININLGGTMRLGAYECTLLDGTRIKSIYNNKKISERHRHRYEINIQYRQVIEDNGFTFSGLCGKMLLEAIECDDHPWFIGVQFHPELKSRPFDPHPLFVSFISNAFKISKASNS